MSMLASPNKKGCQNMAGSSKKAIYAALIGNGLIAVTKFSAAVFGAAMAVGALGQATSSW